MEVRFGECFFFFFKEAHTCQSHGLISAWIVVISAAESTVTASGLFFLTDARVLTNAVMSPMCEGYNF